MAGFGFYSLFFYNKKKKERKPHLTKKPDDFSISAKSKSFDLSYSKREFTRNSSNRWIKPFVLRLFTLNCKPLWDWFNFFLKRIYF